MDNKNIVSLNSAGAVVVAELTVKKVKSSKRASEGEQSSAKRVTFAP